MEKKKVTVKKHTMVKKSTENKTEQSEFGFSSMSKSEILVESNTTETVLIQTVASEVGQEIPQQQADQRRIDNHNRQESVADFSRGNVKSIEDSDTESVVMNNGYRNDGSDVTTLTAGVDFGEMEHLSDVSIGRIPILKISNKSNANGNEGSNIVKSADGDDFGENEHFSGEFISRFPMPKMKNKTDADESESLDNEIGSQETTDWHQNPSTSCNDSKDGYVHDEEVIPVTENAEMVNSDSFENGGSYSSNVTPLLPNSCTTDIKCNGCSENDENLSNSHSTDFLSSSINTEIDIKCVSNFQSEKINDAEIVPSHDKEMCNVKINDIQAKVPFGATSEHKNNRDKLNNDSKENSVIDLVKYFESLKKTPCKKNNPKNTINSHKEITNLEPESKTCNTSIASIERNTVFGSKKFPSPFKRESEYQAKSSTSLRRVTSESKDDLIHSPFSVSNNINDFGTVNGCADTLSDRNASQATKILQRKCMLHNDTGETLSTPKSKIPVSRFSLKHSGFTLHDIAMRSGRKTAEGIPSFLITKRNHTELIPQKIFNRDTRDKSKEKVNDLSALKGYDVKQISPTACNIIRSIQGKMNLISRTNTLMGILIFAVIVSFLATTPGAIKHLLE